MSAARHDTFTGFESAGDLDEAPLAWSSDAHRPSLEALATGLHEHDRLAPVIDDRVRRNRNFRRLRRE